MNTSAVSEPAAAPGSAANDSADCQKSPLAVLLATQRSGTNMLRAFLASHPRLLSLPEVFNDRAPAADPMPGNLPRFHSFARDRIFSDPTAGLPERRPTLVGDYFDLLAKRAMQAGRTAVVGIKYNSLHHADRFWRGPCAAPHVFNLLRERGAPILHLVRQDLVAIVYSQFRAELTGTYVVHRSASVQRIRFTIDPPTMLRRLDFLREDERIVRRWLDGSNLVVLTLRYEDLFSEGVGTPIRAEVMDSIADLLGIDSGGFDPVPTTRKISPASFREELENYEQLEFALRGTPYHEGFLSHA